MERSPILMRSPPTSPRGSSCSRSPRTLFTRAPRRRCGATCAGRTRRRRPAAARPPAWPATAPTGARHRPGPSRPGRSRRRPSGGRAARRVGQVVDLQPGGPVEDDDRVDRTGGQGDRHGGAPARRAEHDGRRAGLDGPVRRGRAEGQLPREDVRPDADRDPGLLQRCLDDPDQCGTMPAGPARPSGPAAPPAAVP